MARTIRFTRLVLAILGVLATLAVGARQAWAGSEATSLSCTPGSVGTCSSGQDCQTQCTAIYGEGAATGQCQAGCCFCILN